MQLHGDVRPPLDLAHLVDVADVGVPDLRLRPRLAKEPREMIPIRLAKELERHGAIQRGIERPIHLRHPALAQKRADLVPADGRRHQRVERRRNLTAPRKAFRHL